MFIIAKYKSNIWNIIYLYYFTSQDHGFGKRIEDIKSYIQVAKGKIKIAFTKIINFAH